MRKAMLNAAAIGVLASVFGAVWAYSGRPVLLHGDVVTSLPPGEVILNPPVLPKAAIGVVIKDYDASPCSSQTIALFTPIGTAANPRYVYEGDRFVTISGGCILN